MENKKLKGNEPVLRIAYNEIKQIKTTLKIKLLSCKTEEEVLNFIQSLTFIKNDLERIFK